MKRGLGFQILYESVIGLPQTTYRSGACGGTFTTTYGTFTSPSYPKNYPDMAECFYTISQPTGFVISVNFLAMDIVKFRWESTCRYDYLDIRDGPSGDSPPLVDKLCGSDIPAPIQSTQNHLWMK